MLYEKEFMLELTDDLRYEIQLALDAAQDSMDTFTVDIETGHERAAANRAYYAVFYCLRAMAVRFEVKTSKHKTIIAWFHKEIIHGRLMDKKFSDVVTMSFKLRTDADYDLSVEISENDLYELAPQIREFIVEAKKLSLQEP
jgi:uncharacterized protein (UPF0332 family)